MRTERTIRHTDTKRILQLCYDNGMTNEGISLRLNCSVRSIQKWWYDTCPSPRFFHRLWMLENSIKKEAEYEVRLAKHNQQEANKKIRKENWARMVEHMKEDGHPEGDCPQCIVILNSGLP